jgi:hypothetical protein
MKHRFVFSSTYELPFGPGKRFGASQGRFVSKLVEGWSINTILQLSTGLPFTPSLATPVANTGTSSRPNRIGSGVLSERTPNRWFDAAAFTTPALYAFGNAGRNILTGPGTHIVDVNFGKTVCRVPDAREERDSVGRGKVRSGNVQELESGISSRNRIQGCDS